MALMRNGLVDLGWKNKKYTWLNRHKDGTFTKERLDRAVANNTWLSKFGFPSVKVLTTYRLDHCLLFFHIGDTSKGRTKKRILIYKAKWALENDGEEIIHLSWQYSNHLSNCWTNIQSKLLQCSRELIKWLANKKKCSKRKIDKKIALLKVLQAQTSLDMMAIKHFEREVDHWLEQ